MLIALSVVSACLAISEALSMIPAIKANGIFQAVYNGLKSLKDFLSPKSA